MAIATKVNWLATDLGSTPIAENPMAKTTKNAVEPIVPTSTGFRLLVKKYRNVLVVNSAMRLEC